ncbi:MAG TPA: YoaK family protein [Rhodanobacteraceae bacterium]|nr:YoaK family protein [Rhodanobacteraceae bacterium]
MRLLAAALSSIGGYVDAVGYLSLGGFFVSFMSGNSTRVGVGLGTGSIAALIALGLIATFVAGVAAGSWTARRASGRAVLRLVAAALLLAAATASVHESNFAFALAAFAMGAVNSTFAHEGGLPVGLTYMTGTLVRIGQALAAIPSGGDRLDWVPYALHWLALIAGATIGTLAEQRLGLGALWIAAVAMTALALAAPLRRAERGSTDV